MASMCFLTDEKGKTAANQKEGMKMKILLGVDEIDYAGILEKFLPIIRDKLKDMDGAMPKMLSGLAALSGPVVRGTINALPQDTKDQMVAYLINHNGEKIIAAAQSFTANQGIGLTITSLSVEQ